MDTQSVYTDNATDTINSFSRSFNHDNWNMKSFDYGAYLAYDIDAMGKKMNLDIGLLKTKDNENMNAIAY